MRITSMNLLKCKKKKKKKINKYFEFIVCSLAMCSIRKLDVSRY